jgi:UDP-glucuronate decarboxylase
MHPNDSRVISNFIIQALQGEPITIYGNGPQTRSFCYVDDMVEGLILMMKTSNEVTGLINLGNPQEYSGVSSTDPKTHRVQIKYRFSAFTQDDPEKRQPDISLAKEILGWSPKVTLGEGLPKTIDYSDNLLRTSR